MSRMHKSRRLEYMPHGRINEGALVQGQSSKIEQFESIESHFGVRLDALSCRAANGFRSDYLGTYVKISGELHSESAERFVCDIRIMGAIYDKHGRVLASAESEKIVASGFLGFETFSFNLMVPDAYVEMIDSARVYPRPSSW